MTRPIPTSADVVVIGGGIMGVSLAWHLARRGVEVVVCERQTVAAGASGRTGALLRQHYSNAPEATLAHESLKVFRAWPETVGGDCGFVESGLIVTVATGPGCEANIELLRRNVAMQQRIGIDTRVISPDEFRALQPTARVDDLAVAAYEPSSGYVDGVAATRAMATAAQQAGAVIAEQTPVVDVLTEGDRVHGVKTAMGTIRAPAVVCASGPWAPSLLTPLGVDVPVTALRVQVAILQQPLTLDHPICAYVDTAAGMFCRPWGPGRILAGVGGGDQHDAVDPDHFEPRNDPDYAGQAIAILSRRLPQMAEAVYLHGHAGLYDVTPDTHPIVGPAGPDGLYLMLGFSGAGFKKAPAVGQCLAELMTEGRASLVDLSPFSLSRFDTDAWRQPWSDTEYTLSSDFGHAL